MKGLVEKKEANTVYLGVKHGCICQESRKERDGFKQIAITLQTGETITKYIKPYDRVEALINEIEWSDREWDGRPYKSWRISMDAAGTPCVLEIPFESKASSRFMKLAENINFTEPVEFSAWTDQEGKMAFNVRQNDQKVPQRYTKDNPGDCPEPVKRMSGKWSYDDQADFLHERMMTVVIPKVEAAAAMRGHENGETGMPPEDHQGSEYLDPDDIPF